MICFEDLPDIVRFRIYEYLLLETEVAVRMDEEGYHQPAFQPNILRANRTIYEEASAIFLKNHFTFVILENINLWRQMPPHLGSVLFHW